MHKFTVSSCCVMVAMSDVGNEEFLVVNRQATFRCGQENFDFKSLVPLFLGHLCAEVASALVYRLLYIVWDL